MANAHSIRLILRDWHQVVDGPALAGDRYWDRRLLAWMPIMVNSVTMVKDYAAVIRKGEE
jgi:hypothetical protein